MDTSSDFPQSPSLHSFQLFYRIASGLVGGTQQGNSRYSLGNDVIDKLSQMQIKHYNFIQLQILQLDKGIRSNAGKLSQHEITFMLIKAKSIMEEMEKLCSRLKVFFIFQLFQKVMICLTIVASLNYHDKLSDESEATLNLGKKKFNQATVNSSKLVKQNVKQQKPKQTGVNKRQKIQIFTSAAIKKRFLGGVSLYNEDYRRHVENQAGVGRFLDIFKVSDQKKKFWIQLESEFKETVGILNQTTENNKRASIFRSEQKGKVQLSMKRLTKKSISCTKSEKARIVEKSKEVSTQFGLNPNIFDYEIETKDISVQKFDNVIESLTEISRGQKILTLQSIKKLLQQVRNIYEQKLEYLGSKIKNQQGEIKQLENRFDQKLLNHKTMGSQTYPCKAVETLTDENKKLKAVMVSNTETIKNLEGALSKQNMSILQFERLGYDNSRRLEQQNKRIVEFQRQCKLLQKNMKISMKSKQNQKQVAFIDKASDEESKIILQRDKILAKMKEEIILNEFDENVNRNGNTKTLLLDQKQEGSCFDRKAENSLIKTDENKSKKLLLLQYNFNPGLKYARSEKIIRFKQGDSIKQQLIQDYWQNKRSQKSLRGEKKMGKSKSISKSIHNISEDLESKLREIHNTNKSIRFDINILDKSESDYHKSSRSKSIKSLKLITSRFKSDKEDKASKTGNQGLQDKCESPKNDQGKYQGEQRILQSKNIDLLGKITQLQSEKRKNGSNILKFCPMEYAFTISLVCKLEDKASGKVDDLTQIKFSTEIQTIQGSPIAENLASDEAFQKNKIVTKASKNKKDVFSRVISANIESIQEQQKSKFRNYASNSVHIRHSKINTKANYTNLQCADQLNLVKRKNNFRNKQIEMSLEGGFDRVKSGYIDEKDGHNNLESTNERESNQIINKTKKGLWNLQGWRFDSLHLNSDEINFQQKKDVEKNKFGSIKPENARNKSVEILKQKMGLNVSADISPMNQTSPQKFFKSQRNSFKNLNSLVPHNRTEIVGKESIKMEKGKDRKKNGVIKDYYVNRKLLKTNKLTVNLNSSTVCQGM